MKPRERVLKAIEHQEADRIPLDYAGTPETTEKLYRHFGVKDREELIRKLNIDMRMIIPAYIGPELRVFPDGTWEDEWGSRYKKQHYAIGSYDEVCYYPLAEAKSVEDVEKYNWPKAEWYDYEGFACECEKYEDYAILAGYAAIYYAYWRMRGMDQALIDIALEPELAKAIIFKITDFSYTYFTEILEISADRITMIHIADDFGTQEGLMISPEMFREFFAPSMTRLIDLVHSYGVKVFFHSCGSVIDIIPDLIEARIDVLDPLQPQAKGMIPRELKRRFGDKLCFHGSMDVQGTLPYGTVEDVKREVKDRIEALGPGGGFILAPCHNIQPDTPVENVIAMYETALEFGIYK